MTDTLILRLDAPLMSFSAPKIDQINPTRRVPGLAQIVGLLANALGWRHREAERLQRLQERVRFGSLLLREGEELMDYQTVDLTQAHLDEPGWTTLGRTEGRAGGPVATHQRFRYYRADAMVLVALKLEPAEEAPTGDDLADALDRPARPLFIGRKNCAPAAPILAGRVTASDLGDALQGALALPGIWGTRHQGRSSRADGAFEAELPTTDDGRDVRRYVDGRDWRNQFHGRERMVVTRFLHPSGTVR